MVYVWSISDGSGAASVQIRARYTMDDIDRYVDVNDLSAGPAVGADFTLLVNGLNPDPMARCLCVTMVNDAAGADRGISVRIRGLNQFGISVQETVTFPNKAAATTNIMFTRNAYRFISQVTYMARTGGAVTANDRLDVGQAVLAGTAAGTHDASNGAGATDYKAFGLPTVISPQDGLGALVAADFPTQIHGTIITEDGTSGVQTWAAISRANDFKCDPVFHTITTDEEFVAALGAGASAIEAIITVTPNLRRTENVTLPGSTQALPVPPV